MEMSTLTTNLVHEQFMSTTEAASSSPISSSSLMKEPELNNNSICANDEDTCNKNIITATVVVENLIEQQGRKEEEAGELVSVSDPVPVEPTIDEIVPDTNSLLLPPLIEMPSDPNQGNEMLQNLPKDTSISFPDVSAQTLDENQDVKMALPDATDPTSLLNPNSSSLLTDPLRTPPRPMIEDRTTVTDQFIAVAPPAASAPPVVTVKPSELEPEMKDKESLEEKDEFPATSVKQEPSDSSVITDQMEKFDEKVEGLIRRSKLNGCSPNDGTRSPEDVHHHSNHRLSPLTTNSNQLHVPGLHLEQPHHHQVSQHQQHHLQMHPVPVSRPPVSHPYGGHHYFPRAIPSHISEHPSAYPIDSSHGMHHHHRYSSSIGQIPFHHQSSISEDDERDEMTPSPESKDSALNLAMNAVAYQQQQQSQQQQQHFANMGTISQPIQQHHHSNQTLQSSGSSSSFNQHLQPQHQQLPATVHHHPATNQNFQAHHNHHQQMPHHHHHLHHHHHFPPHHQLPGRNPYHSTPPPPLISSLASSLSRHSGNSLTYNQATNNNHTSVTNEGPFQMTNQHLPPPNHHPFADPSLHPSAHHVVGPGYRPPTSIPVSVVTSLSEIRRKQSLNPTQYNTLVNGSSVQEYKFLVDQNKSDNMRANSITVKTRTALPSSIISTGTRSSARTNTVTGVHEGGAGGITGSNDLVSVISGQPSGPAGGVSCTPLAGPSSSHQRVTPMAVVGPRPQPVPSGNPNKPYKCPLCEKELASKNVFQLHLRSHSGERPFACNLCGNAFSQKTSLTRHMRSHTGERPYPCNQCNKRFADKERIKIHMRTHTGEKPFACAVCGKTFSQKSTVKRHMSVHTGAKPYKCPQCEKGFANRGNLTAHTKTHQLQSGAGSVVNAGHRPGSSDGHGNNGHSPVKMISRGSGSSSYMVRHPSGSSNQSITSSETSETNHTNGTLVITNDSPCFHRHDTQGSNSSQSSSAPLQQPQPSMVA